MFNRVIYGNGQKKKNQHSKFIMQQKVKEKKSYDNSLAKTAPLLLLNNYEQTKIGVEDEARMQFYTDNSTFSQNVKISVRSIFSHLLAMMFDI